MRTEMLSMRCKLSSQLVAAHLLMNDTRQEVQFARGNIISQSGSVSSNASMPSFKKPWLWLTRTTPPQGYRRNPTIEREIQGGIQWTGMTELLLKPSVLLLG